jgi:hypothetical protein
MTSDTALEVRPLRVLIGTIGRPFGLLISTFMERLFLLTLLLPILIGFWTLTLKKS